MALITSNIKEKIISNLNNIINFKDDGWNSLDTEIKIKIIHNLCNLLKTNSPTDSTSINIPLKHLRPKKLIQFCGINNQTNSEIYNEFRKNIINVNREFRTNYNSSNKNYCFANLSKTKYDLILYNYNYNIYHFLLTNIDKINYKHFYSNLLGENQQKIISIGKNINSNSNSNSNLNNNFTHNNLKIKQINYKENFLNIEFNNGILIQLELYLTSEKITNNIPAKYKINLINIF
jgi:hypothetical protein